MEVSVDYFMPQNKTPLALTQLAKGVFAPHNMRDSYAFIPPLSLSPCGAELLPT